MLKVNSQEAIYPYYEDTVTETSLHYKAIHYLEGALEKRYEADPLVFVGANNFVYWEEGNPDHKDAPDVYVCFGAQNRDRKSYKTWEENGIGPQVIFEITSRSSRFVDLGPKKGTYELMGVEEYYLFDPLGEYIPEQLRAFQNKGGGFRQMTQKRVHSPRLGLDLRVEDKLLRLFLPGSSQRLRTYSESERAVVAAEERAAAAEERAARAEAELRELKRSLEQ